MIKKQKTTIKRMNTIFNIKTKQNQMEIDETRKKKSKQRKTKKQKTRIIIEFFLHYFLSK
jgi:hypothetical protein